MGWNTDALTSALAFAAEHNSTGVVVAVDGRIIAEQYWNADATTAKDVASVQKSIVSVLVGIEFDAGRLDLDDPVSRWLGSGWSRAGAGEARISLRHVMSMDSGLDDRGNRVAPPGSLWYYNTPVYSRLQLVLERESGSDLQQLSERLLFGPTGMSSARWQRRGGGQGERGCVLTPRDMARFGLLVLARGSWAGGQLVSGRYLAMALSSSQPLNPAYGLLWWLNGTSIFQLPGPAPTQQKGPLVSSAPRDLVAALGAGDQKIYVVPGLRLVIARQGAAAGLGKTGFDEQWWQRLSAAMPTR